VDERLRVPRVPRVRRDSDRDRRAHGVARGRSGEQRRSHRPPDPVGDAQCLLGAGLGEDQRELLAAEACGHVVLAQLGAEDVRDPRDHGVTREMAVRVVDVAEVVEVGHHDRHRPADPGRPFELLAQRRGEVPRVVEACLRVDTGLRLQRGHRERAVDEEERGDDERDEPRVVAPHGREDDAGRREHEIGRDRAEIERRALAPARQPDQRHAQPVAHADEDDACRGADEGAVGAMPKRIPSVQLGSGQPDGERGEGHARHVERLHPEREPPLQPVRHVLDDCDESHQLGREQERRRDDEDDGRVVGAAAAGLDCEALGDRDRDGEDRERRPARRVEPEPGDQRRRDRHGHGDDEPEIGDSRERKVSVVGVVRRSKVERRLEGDCAHAASLSLAHRLHDRRVPRGRSDAARRLSQAERGDARHPCCPPPSPRRGAAPQLPQKLSQRRRAIVRRRHPFGDADAVHSFERRLSRCGGGEPAGPAGRARRTRAPAATRSASRARA
jgi:hypothetical protein